MLLVTLGTQMTCWTRKNPLSEMLRTGGDVDASMAQVVRDNISREQRAELENFQSL